MNNFEADYEAIKRIIKLGFRLSVQVWLGRRGEGRRETLRNGLKFVGHYKNKNENSAFGWEGARKGAGRRRETEGNP